MLTSIIAQPFPQSYEAWVEFSSDLSQEHGTEGVARIVVNPKEFAEYLCDSGQCADLKALLNFAAFNPWQDPD